MARIACSQQKHIRINFLVINGINAIYYNNNTKNGYGKSAICLVPHVLQSNKREIIFIEFLPCLGNGVVCPLQDQKVICPPWSCFSCTLCLKKL